MNVKRILYISNADKQVSHKTVIEGMFRSQDSEKLEIIALVHDSNSKWLNELSNNNVDIKIISENITIKTISKISNQNDISIIIFSSDENNKSSMLSMLKMVIKKLNVPLIVIDEKDDKEIFKHPVTAVNWSARSDYALDFIIKYKGIIEELEIVNVINKKLTVKDIRELKEKLITARKLCLDKKIDAESHIYAGNTADEILLSARDYRATMIVVGRGNKKAGKRFSSNTAWHVCQKSKIPVLIV